MSDAVMAKNKVLVGIAWLLIAPLAVSACAILDFIGAPTEVPEKTEVSEKAKEENPIGKVVVSDFIIGAGDILEINVYRQKDLDTKVTVLPSGTIFLPLIGEVPARGHGIRELRQSIIERYSQYLVDPQVSIKVDTIKSQKAYVLGEVKAPGMITLDTNVFAVEAIARVGGPTLDAEITSVLLIRGDFQNPELKSLNIKKALNGEDLTQNLLLRGGDIVYVPRSFISDVTWAFRQFAAVIGPIVAWQQGISVWPAVEAVLRGDYTSDLRRKESGGGGAAVVVP